MMVMMRRSLLLLLVAVLSIFNVKALKQIREKLTSTSEVNDFLKQYCPERLVMLAFFETDEEGGVLHRTKSDGAYSKFLEIGNVNLGSALGLVTDEELLEAFAVPKGSHFFQVEQDEANFKFRHARFFSSNHIAESTPGEIISILHSATNEVEKYSSQRLPNAVEDVEVSAKTDL